MANALYPLYKQALITGSADISLSAGTVKVALVDTAVYAYSAAHEFLTSLSGVGGTAQTLGTKTVVNGLFDSTGLVTYTAVAGTVSYEALVLYIDTGVAGTSRLVAFIDTGVTGLPVTSNGGDITVDWNASGIFQL